MLQKIFNYDSIIKFYRFKKIIEKYYAMKLLLQFNRNKRSKFVPLNNNN